jgi:hypothetical protein
MSFAKFMARWLYNGADTLSRANVACEIGSPQTDGSYFAPTSCCCLGRGGGGCSVA